MKLTDQARIEKKWIHCVYQDLWWSPRELDALQADGKFCWDDENFQLRDPYEHLNYLMDQARKAKEAIMAFERRIENENALR